MRPYQGALPPAHATIMQLGNGVRPPEARLCGDVRPEGLVRRPGVHLQNNPKITYPFNTPCMLLMRSIAHLGTCCIISYPKSCNIVLSGYAQQGVSPAVQTSAGLRQFSVHAALSFVPVQIGISELVVPKGAQSCHA